MNVSSGDTFENRTLRIAACASWVLIPLFLLVAGVAGPMSAMRFLVLPVWLVMGVHGAYYLDLLHRGFGWSNVCVAKFGGAMLAITCIACWCAGIEAGLTTGLALTVWIPFAITWMLSTTLALGFTSRQAKGLLFLLVLTIPLWLAGLAWWSFRLFLSLSFAEAGSPVVYSGLLIVALAVPISGLIIAWRARRAVRARPAG